MPRKPVMTILMLVVCAFACYGIWSREESIEWWTSVSDRIAILEVRSTEEMDPLNKYWNSQKVSCGKIEALVGSCPDTITFRQDYREGAERRLAVEDKVLAFMIKPREVRCDRKDDDTEEIAFWINLTKPDPNSWYHKAYDNNYQLLTDSEAILAKARSRLGGVRGLRRPKKRGLIIPSHWYAEPNELVIGYSDFVRTADPEYRDVLVRMLQKDGYKIDAIYNLISYPSEETRPYLYDDKTAKIYAYGPDRRTVTYYPVRQATYLALRLLGTRVKKPEGYLENYYPRPFAVGFEDEDYFPYGDWKRLASLENHSFMPNVARIAFLSAAIVALASLILLYLRLYKKDKMKEP